MHDTDRQKRNVLLVLMLVTALFGLFFAYQNSLRGQVAMAVLESFFVLYSVLMIPVILRTLNFRRWALAYILPWTCAMLAILAMPGSSITVFIWTLVLPLIVHFLLGRRLGLALSIAGLAASALIAWYRFGLPGSPEDFVFAGNISLAAVLILLLAHIYERGRELTERGLQQLAATDTLTQLANRMLLDQTFSTFSKRALSRQRPLTMLLMDLDHFKRINDSYGHSAGDQVLAEFAVLLRQRTRAGDFLCRLGGEEFLVLLPETDAPTAEAVAESIRQRLQDGFVRSRGQKIRLTLSIGLAELDRDGNDLDTLLRSADRRMYRAKTLGRNQVIAEDA
ncbi:MAG: GGDEF domain-containing protein [Wenzhouxiangellaceae bacterium]|nr:GGDEF domain-containing protein [Wenzhouxiangellaceae bacterium]